MMRGLTCFALLVISAVGVHPLDAQVPARRATTPPPPRKESLRHRLLRLSGIADNPSTLKGPAESASGQIWLAELRGQRTRALTTGGGYRSPVFIPGRRNILALKGADLVRLPVGGEAPERLYTINGIIKLVGFSRDDPDKVLVLTEGTPGRPRIGWVSVKTGKIVPVPYDSTSSEDQRMLEHLRGWDRVYGGTSVYVNKLTKDSFSGRVEWTDVFVKAGEGEPINVSRCEDVACGQPSLSADGRLVVFVKAEQQ
jgi:hypothetical protein